MRCYMTDERVAQTAIREGITRATAAMDVAAPELAGGICVIGNAPTALLRLMELMDAGKASPALVVGLPVGFVNAAESKALLLEKEIPFITNVGRKGGSNVAAGRNQRPDCHGWRRKMSKPRYGTLYGIGVGPGDPDLIPLKSVNILKQVATIFAASSSKNVHSQAVNIARPHIPQTTPVRILSFPMTKDQAEKEACWKENAKTIIDELEKGQDVAFLTLGDSMTFATYGYVLRYVLELAPEAPVVTVPGISAYQAAAARVNRPLVEGEESLLILSGAEGGERLRELSQAVDNVVFMKAYRHAADICDVLEEKNMLTTSVAVANCGLEDEAVIEDLNELKTRKPGYWTLVIGKKASKGKTP